MKLSQMPLKPTPSGVELIPIFDPNEPTVSLRNKLVLLDTVRGTVGADGKSAYQVWLDAGNVGDVDDFFESLHGPAGPSAYQAWLDAGNVGTEADFIEFIKGQAGTIWHNGDGLPDSGLGVIGDYYVDNSSGIVYYKDSLGWGTGSFSMKGIDGSRWNSDPGPPNPITGSDRDYYLDLDNGDVYGPKLFGDWGVPVMNIKGPNGVSWFADSGIPDPLLGSIGDFYIDLLTGDTYGPKAFEDWGPITGNLKGPQGIQGSIILYGNGIPDNSLGNDSDFYIDIDTGSFYGPKLAGDWGVSFVKLLQNLDEILAFGANTQTPITVEFDGGGGDATDIIHTGEYLEFNIYDGSGDSKTRLKSSVGLAGVPAQVLLPDHSGTLVTQDDLNDAISAIPDPLVYKGSWDADTNTPPLLNTDVAEGHVYRVSIAGTHDFGSGPIDFNVGDKAVNNGTTWEKWDVIDEVVSVNSQTGEVILDTDDISEGSINLYFTDERAQDSVGIILTDSAWITFDYNDGTPSITAEIIDDSIGNEKLTNSSIIISGTEVDLGDGISRDDIIGVTTDGLIKRTAVNTYSSAVAGTDYSVATNGADGQALTSNGAGGFGTPVTLVSSATTDTTNANNISSGVLSKERGGAGDVTGILKADGLGEVSAAIAGTDYSTATNGIIGQALVSDGAGGFGTPLTLGSAALEDTSAFDPAGSASTAQSNAQTYADNLIVQTIDEDDVDHTPSADAVFNALATKIDTSALGVTVAELVGGLIPSINLPSFVDDVVEVDEFVDLPVTGETGKIYVVLEDNFQYRWSGSAYTQIFASPGTTDNVTEGVSNLYFTDIRAQNAVVVQTINDADTTHSPSSDVVFDALALKANTSSLAASATTDTTNADNISSGVLNKNRGGAGDVTGILKADGLGVVSAAVAGTDYAPVTNGTDGQLLTSNAAGGFGTPVNSNDLKKSCLLIPIFDQTTPISTGVVFTGRIPYDFTLTDIKASLAVAQTSGSLFTVDVKKNGVSIFSTLLTFENTETTTKTATVPKVLSSSPTVWLDDDVITIEITQVGASADAAGLSIYFIGFAT